MAQSSRFYALTRLAARISKQPHSRQYVSYIQSPQWRQLRLAHIEGVDGICEICKFRKAIQVHHWNYRNLGQERPEDLCAVCLTCHHHLHAILVPDAANDNQLNLDLDETG